MRVGSRENCCAGALAGAEYPEGMEFMADSLAKFSAVRQGAKCGNDGLCL